jgi:hypothetical protein
MCFSPGFAFYVVIPGLAKREPGTHKRPPLARSSTVDCASSRMVAVMGSGLAFGLP